MQQPTEVAELILPSLLDRRWRDIKTGIFNLVKYHSKVDLVLELIKLRERYTSAPTLSEITNFTGFDVAIHTVNNWTWNRIDENRSIEFDANEIGKYGAELMVVHTLRESLRNNLLDWDGNKLTETERGILHFSALNSFNVDITGSRIDIAKKRFSQGRLNKQQRKMDPINKIPSVKRLYWDNSILMLLRSPLPFYKAMQNFTDKEREYLLKLHSQLITKTENQSMGVIRVRLKKGSKAANILHKLTTPQRSNDRRPQFVGCVEVSLKNKEKVDFKIGIGALTMFVMFLLGFDRDHLDEKAKRAETAVKDIIEHFGYYKVIESNVDVIQEAGEVITEIDIIAQSKLDNTWITFEVKDFSFWRGWIWGQGADQRKEYYVKAIEKLEVKEEFICKKYSCQEVTSIIVTSIPEPFSMLEKTQFVYLSDLNETLARLSGTKYTPRKRHQSSNFLIRYFERLHTDYSQSDNLQKPLNDISIEINELREKMQDKKDEYDGVRQTYQMLISEHDTLKLEEKLISKRIIKDTGEKHYHLESELNETRTKISRSNKNINIRAEILRDLKLNYQQSFQALKKIEKEKEKIGKSRERLLNSRLF
ncbi:MAG: hypothetical protein HeimC2_44460 [Candidatus Heimdallarchaeota archaeon LC_2]|nr:MAG: hypothetical protein HeimC2_44460 [Candidatus Heimdallarchaeota archaeon LC_2]